MYSFNFVPLLLFAFSLLALFPHISNAEFAPLKEDETQPCKLRLSQAKDIPHRCNLIRDRTSDLEVWQSRLSFDFGRLSRAEFQQLKNIYSGAYKSKSLVTYNPNQHYQLIDFLPPIIQALNNHRFIPESTEIEFKRPRIKQAAIYELLGSRIRSIEIGNRSSGKTRTIYGSRIDNAKPTAE